MARRTTQDKTKNSISGTLYCSFCGKSQHEVFRLIAGAAVYICDECTFLCFGIVQEAPSDNLKPEGENNYRHVLKLEFKEALTGTEKNFFPALTEALNAAYPNCTISLKSIASHQTRGDAVYLYFDTRFRLTDKDVEQLENDIEQLSLQLRIAEQRLLAEKAGREKYENLYRELVDQVFPVVVQRLRERGELREINTKTLLVAFADIVGFSTMTELERQNKVELMRLIGRAIVVDFEKGLYVNTWGDGLVAAFTDPTQGLRCACKFVSHLEIDGIDIRVGVNWGAVKISHNPVTQRLDIDGEAVNVGARIEPLAEPGEVLASSTVIGLGELDKGSFHISERQVTLTKNVGSHKAGETMKVYAVRNLPNK